MKCKYKKECENYRLNSYTCNNFRNPWYCGIFNQEQELKINIKNKFKKNYKIRCVKNAIKRDND